MLLCVLALLVGFNLPTAFSTIEPEIGKKRVKKLARKEARKLDKKQHPVDTAGLEDGAVTAPKLADGVLFELDCNAGPPPGDEMIRVGTFCIDKYEASLWDAPVGGNQIPDAQIDSYCPDNGQPLGNADCARFYARSVAGVQPSREITWFC